MTRVSPLQPPISLGRVDLTRATSHSPGSVAAHNRRRVCLDLDAPSVILAVFRRDTRRAVKQDVESAVLGLGGAREVPVRHPQLLPWSVRRCRRVRRDEVRFSCAPMYRPHALTKPLSLPRHAHSRRSFEALESWLSDARALASPELEVVVVGNKMDQEEDRQVSYLEGSRWAQEHGALFVETSSRTGENVEQVRGLSPP